MPRVISGETALDVRRLLWEGRHIRLPGTQYELSYGSDIYFCKQGEKVVLASSDLCNVLVGLYLQGAEVTDATV